jgi:tetrathionate reductase subunit B
LSKKRYALVVDAGRCIGCHTCSVACKSENGVPLGVFRMWVKQIEKGTYPHVTQSFLPLLCNNCDNPPCVPCCPTRATYKREDGLVMIDPHRCIGCRYCVVSCPYDMRFINPLLPIAQKCDWCSQRVDAGLTPACVVACPTGALVFGDLDDRTSTVRRVIATQPVQVIKPESNTKPHVFYVKADAQAIQARGGAAWISE